MSLLLKKSNSLGVYRKKKVVLVERLTAQGYGAMKQHFLFRKPYVVCRGSGLGEWCIGRLERQEAKSKRDFIVCVMGIQQGSLSKELLECGLRA